ncbi:FAD-binding protein [Cladorrhinum sp. PSN259]|nr:FAD-binding protein [Cladorrhinum sp. PSN259]
MKYLLLLLSSTLSLSVLARPSSTQPRDLPTCRLIPGDASWPSAADWASLNQQVEGRLIASTPLGAVCHNTFVSSALGKVNTYDAAKCSDLRNTWFLPETHYVHPSSPMQYTSTNNSCNPFDSDPSAPCSIGNHAVYAINATAPAHVQAGIAFARQHNIRLVIRNTGHDYLGRSTGPHSLAIWTHNLKSTELISSWGGPGDYKGPAMKLGAGVMGIDAYRAAHTEGLVVVGGNCPTVGLSGGYTQGGGLGPLTSVHGLAADQVLEWTVVTADGALVTANANSNPDLFWALRGGGGGTFGVVTSMTVKAFPDSRTSSAFVNVVDTGSNTDAIYKGFETFISTQLAALVDQGVYVLWVLNPAGFFIQARFALGMKQSELDALMQPTVRSLQSLNLAADYVSMENPDFLTAFETTPGAQWNVSDNNTGGRLAPRSLVTDPAKVGALVSAIRSVGQQTLITGVAFNATRGGVSSPDEVAAHPRFRDSLFNIFLGLPTRYDDWQANLDAMDTITNKFLADLEAVTPGAGAYLNEADVQQPDWQTEFYGSHWDRLSKVKAQYDPEGLFYARTAVGSEQWTEQADGRLCKL